MINESTEVKANDAIAGRLNLLCYILTTVLSAKYRVKHHIGIGYFAQIRHSLFSGWKTIGKHPDGYGLYENKHTNYPLNSYEEAQSRSTAYAVWKEKIDKGDVVYKDV